jgi:hypothetical protein
VTKLKAKHPELKELLEMFQTDDIVFENVLSEKGFVCPDDTVLRKADTAGALIPAHGATALVLRHGLTRPTIKAIRELTLGYTKEVKHQKQRLTAPSCSEGESLSNFEFTLPNFFSV